MGTATPQAVLPAMRFSNALGLALVLGLSSTPLPFGSTGLSAAVAEETVDVVAPPSLFSAAEMETMEASQESFEFQVRRLSGIACAAVTFSRPLPPPLPGASPHSTCRPSPG